MALVGLQPTWLSTGRRVIASIKQRELEVNGLSDYR